MNIKKIESLLEQIENAAMLTCDDSPMLHSVHVESFSNMPDNEVLYINWHDDEGYEFSVTFTEHGLNEATIENNKIKLCDHEGNDSVITLYAITPEPVVTVW